MTFQEQLAKLPSVDHLSGITILNEQGEQVHFIPAIEGKLGSLRVYNAMADEFAYYLNPEVAEYGLSLFAEHVADAEQNPGKHPNIDLLFKIIEEQLNWVIKPHLKG